MEIKNISTDNTGNINGEENMDNRSVFAVNLKRIMKSNRVDRYQLCEALGFKYSTVSEWLQGNKFPRIDKIEAIAKYFNISKSELIENKTKKLPQELTDDDLKFALFGDADMDDELLDDIKKIAQIQLRLRKEKERNI